MPVAAPVEAVEFEVATAGSTTTEKRLRWIPRRARITTYMNAQCGSYLALGLGGGLEGWIVECGTRRPLWLPYVDVDEIDDQTGHAQRLGARVLLEPREEAAGWRSVVSTPEAGEIAFWQTKR